MIMLQQFADDRGNIVGSRCRANGLQIAAGAERAPSPSITSTLISSDDSTCALSCSSFFAIERSIELKAPGRLRVRVAIGPSILSSAGSSGKATWSGIGIVKALGEELGAFK